MATVVSRGRGQESLPLITVNQDIDSVPAERWSRPHHPARLDPRESTVEAQVGARTYRLSFDNHNPHEAPRLSLRKGLEERPIALDSTLLRGTVQELATELKHRQAALKATVDELRGEPAKLPQRAEPGSFRATQLVQGGMRYSFDVSIPNVEGVGDVKVYVEVSRNVSNVHQYERESFSLRLRGSSRQFDTGAYENQGEVVKSVFVEAEHLYRAQSAGFKS